MSKGQDIDLLIEHPPPPRMRKNSSTSKSTSAGPSKPTTAAERSIKTSDRINSSHSRSSTTSNSNHNRNTSDLASSTVDRTSKASIRDDPFFRPSQSASAARMAEKVRNESTKSSTEPAKTASIPPVNLVVLGAPKVGKSTFIQRALDLRQLPTARGSAKKMSLDSVIYLVRLIEVDRDEVVLSGKGRIVWPKSVDGQPFPSIDGVMILYDVTNRNSVADFNNILGIFSRSDLPCVLVSCKCDHPPRARQIEAGVVEELGQNLGGIEAYQTSANVPESQKRCISILLRAILAKTAESNQSTASRKRAESLGKNLTLASDPSSTRSRQPPPLELRNQTKGKESSAVRSSSATPYQRAHASRLSSSFTLETPELTRTSSVEGPLAGSDWESRPIPGSPTSYLLDSALRPGTADSQEHNTFLDMDDDDQSEILGDNISISQQSTVDMVSLKLTEKEQNETGLTFDELVDRVLELPMSKADAKVVPIFLCLYRKFATPGQLLSAILARFDTVERSNQPQLSKVGEQLRYLQVVAQWTGEYPSDFAGSSTRDKIMSFIARLEKSRIFTYAAREIANHLEVIVEDDDTTWALKDSGDVTARNESLMTQSSSTTLVSQKSKASVEDSGQDSESCSREDITESSPRHSAAASLGSTIARSHTGSTQSLATLMTYEEASREAQTLNPVPRNRLTKILWRQFMAYPGEEIARELTRIDWVMYSSIRPRDLVRHVSLNSDKKNKTKSLENVNRMINHFNHVALFVSSMVLLRDKPKHRAMALEKFMHIAWKLRQQNNYNSLGSVIAGINGTAIHRLAMTRDLVPPPVQKEFMRLVILMGTAKSHFAYRLAWENSFSEKIPFLPLHRRDLVAAEDGNRTFVGPNEDRINWKKFEIMGDVIIEIMRSQDRPYPYMYKNDEILRLVLETRFLEGDEDTVDPYQELYERSVQVEPAGAADAKKSFGWLRSR